MIKPEQVPDEVAWKLLVQHDKLWSVGGLSIDEVRASIAAAINAWPGVDYRPGSKVTKTWRDPGKIILPLPTEKSDD